MINPRGTIFYTIIDLPCIDFAIIIFNNIKKLTNICKLMSSWRSLYCRLWGNLLKCQTIGNRSLLVFMFVVFSLHLFLTGLLQNNISRYIRDHPFNLKEGGLWFVSQSRYLYYSIDSQRQKKQFQSNLLTNFPPESTKSNCTTL